jgi:hypothetical protein
LSQRPATPAPTIRTSVEIADDMGTSNGETNAGHYRGWLFSVTP